MSWAILLILVGLLLLVAEVFIPSGGVLVVLAIVALVVGVVMVFYAPESEGGGLYGGLITLTVLLLAIPVIVTVAFHYWPRSPVGRRMFLPAPMEEDTVAALPDHHTFENLRGQIGQTLTQHSPSGVSLIQSRRVDTKTEGMFVAAGQWVRVVDVRPGQVTVRPLTDRELRELPEDLTA